MKDLKLTEKEVAVFKMIMTGKTTTEIADSLGAKYAVVRFHMANILKKFKVKTRIELACLLQDEQKVRMVIHQSVGRQTDCPLENGAKLSNEGK